MSFFFEIPAAVKFSSEPVWKPKNPCMQCPLRDRKEDGQCVSSAGVEQPLVYFVGEAPGETEVLEKKPFVGLSGQYLRRFLTPGILARSRFGNAVKCRPPDNMTPTKIPIEYCSGFLFEDIAASKPKLIVALGAVASRCLLALDEQGAGRWRGQYYPLDINGHICWLYPTYHPAYILREERDDRSPPRSKHGVAFLFDLRNVIELAEQSPPPVILHPNPDHIEVIDGLEEDSEEKALDVLERLSREPVLACDLETNQLRPYGANSRILSIGFGTHEQACAISLKGWSLERQRTRVLERICQILLEPRIRKVFHNAIFDLEWLGAKLGRQFVRGVRAECTMAQAYVLDSATGPLDLDSLLRRYFGNGVKHLSEHLNIKNLEYENLREVLIYNALDVKYTHALFEVQQERMLRMGREALYRRQLRRIPTFVHAQLQGVTVSLEVLDAHCKRLQLRSQEALQKMNQCPDMTKWRLLHDAPLNPASTVQLNRFFKEVAKLPEYSEQISVDEETLSKLKHPVAKAVLELRKSEKLLSTYVNAYRDKWLFPDGKIHTSYNLLRTLTGRTASSSPNQQNWPSRRDKWVKKQFAAPSGYKYLKVDMGQIEARIIGVHSKDAYYCKALRERYDIHQEWARKIASAYPKLVGGRKGLNDAAVMKRFRTDIKNAWTFPAFYGAGALSIAGYLGIPESVVYPLFDEFWRTFSGVKRWQNKLITFFNEHGYVESLSGRRRKAPASVNEILNSPIQGDSSDVVVEAMDELSEQAEVQDKPYLQAIINIHDDLTFLVPEKKVDQALEEIVPVMLYPKLDWIDVPLSVECELGSDLGTTEPIGTYFSDDF